MVAILIAFLISAGIIESDSTYHNMSTSEKQELLDTHNITIDNDNIIVTEDLLW